MNLFKSLLLSIFVLGVFVAFAQPVQAIEEPVVADTAEFDEPPVYNSPQSILSGFFGKRKASMLLNGVQDMVGVTVTGLSPLVVLSVSGPVVYLLTEADQREHLVFFYQPWFFSILIVITVLVFLKDTLLTWAGWLKTPLNILAAFFHFAGFLMGYFFLYHKLMGGGVTGDGESAGIYGLFLVLIMFLFYTSVWILGNCVEVLIMISPFPFVDLVLKGFRLFLIIAMYVLCWIHPLLGLLIALPIIIISLITFERSLRLFWLGVRLIADLVMFRKHEVTEEDDRITVFNIASGFQLPWFTLGHLVLKDGTWHFAVRRFLIGPTKMYALQFEKISIARGTVYPSLIDNSEESPKALLRLMPVYREQEEALSDLLNAEEVVDMSLTTSIKGGWKWVTGLWKKEPSKLEVDPTSTA